MLKDNRTAQVPPAVHPRSAPARRNQYAPTHDQDGNMRELLECVVANAECAIAVLKGTELRYTMVNPAYQAIAPGEQMVGRAYREVFPEAAQAGMEEQILRVLKTGEPWLVKTCPAPVPGKPDAVWQGKVVRLPLQTEEEPSVLVMIRDVTERVQAEQALRSSEQKLKAMFEHSNAGLVLFEAAAPYRVIAANRFYEQLWPEPWASRGLAGVPLTEFAPGLEEAGITDILRGVVRTRQGRFIRNTPYDHMIGGRRWWNWTLEPVIQDGEVVALAHLAVEVTAEVKARELLQGVFDHIPVLLCIWDPQLKTFQFNQHMTHVLGWTEADTLDGNFMARAYPDPVYREQVIQYMQSLEHGWRDFKTTAKDGTAIDCSWTNITLPDGRTIGIGVDIRHRKQAEAALAANENKYRTLFENMAEEVHFWQLVRDSAGEIKTWRLVDVNPPTLKSWGRQSVEEISGKTTDEIFGPGATDHYLPVVRKIFALGVPHSFEDYFPNLDKHFRFTSVPFGEYFITTGADITEIKKAELALREAHGRLTLAQSAAQLGIHEFHPVTGAIIWDDRVRELWGLGPNDPIDYEVFMSRLHPDDRAPTQAAVDRALDPAGNGHYCAEYRLVHPDRTIWVAATGRVTFENGRPVRLVGTVQDITERKEFQQELERLVHQRTVKLQELVGELEHFSYTITHDMRAPLRAMRGFAEMATEYCSDCSKGEPREFLRRIVIAADRMDNLITDALNYNKAVRQELALEPIDADALLRGMLDSYPEFLPSRAHITLQGKIPFVMANQAGLTQCLSNVLGNAVKFVKPGETPNVRVWSDTNGDRVRIYIEDQGIGIPESLLPRVFDMFSRGDTKHEGTGIGLALVRKVMERMGGKVGLESTEGEGSRFWLELTAVGTPAKY